MATLTQADSSRTRAVPLPANILSSSPEETRDLGRSIALLLEKGSIVALRGPLGAGKTCLVKGIAAGLGIQEEVTSPTYTIILEYEAENFHGSGESVVFYHIDAYRLDGNDDFSAIGGEEIVFGKGISVIEWSERIPDFIPPAAIKIDIAMQEGSQRLIRVYREDSPPMED